METKLKLENQLCFPLYAASKKIISKYTPILSEFNLTYTQYIVLLVMFEKQTCNIKDIGEALFLDSGTLSPLIKKLERKGFLTKKRDLSDERNVLITLTKKGKELEDKLSVVPNKIASCFNLNSKEANDLYTILYKLLKEEKK